MTARSTAGERKDMASRMARFGLRRGACARQSSEAFGGAQRSGVRLRLAAALFGVTALLAPGAAGAQQQGTNNPPNQNPNQNQQQQPAPQSQTPPQGQTPPRQAPQGQQAPPRRGGNPLSRFPFDQIPFGELARRAARPAAIAPRVALIKATVYYNDSRALSATVREVRLVNTYAPKSYARDAGDWMVMIYGYGVEESVGRRGNDNAERPPRLLRRYRVLDPGVGVLRETPPGSDQPFERVLLNGPYEWRLVAPLYDGDAQYDVRTIEVIDMRNGRVLLSQSFV